jgi:hypothetical protein
MFMMFAPPWFFVVSLCCLSIASGVLGVGLFLGPAIDLMVIGGFLQAAKLSLYVFLLRTPDIPLPVRAFAVFFIAAVTLFVAFSMLAVTYAVTAVVNMPPGLEGWETEFRWAFITVCVAWDTVAMILLPPPLAEAFGPRRRYA